MRAELKALLASGLLALPAGAIWVWWSHPAQWMMTERGLIMTEQLARGQFDVVAKFVIVNAVLGLFVGGTISYLVAPRDCFIVPVALVSSVFATLVCWLVGFFFGPPDPRKAQDLAVGELTPTPLTVDTIAAFFIASFVAVLVVSFAVYYYEDKGADAKQRVSEQLQPE